MAETKILVNGKPLKTDIHAIIAKRLAKKRKAEAALKQRKVCADYRGQRFYQYGDKWRKEGETELILYRRSQKKKKLGEKPNPKRLTELTYKGLTKKEERKLEKLKASWKKPIPIYEILGWQFTRVWPPKPKKKKKIEPIPFIKFIENPKKPIYGKTTFQKALFKDIDYWLKWNEAKNSDYSLKNLVKAVVECYKPNFKNNPDWEQQFTILVKTLLKQSKDYAIWQEYDETIGFEFPYEEYSQYHQLLIQFKPKLELIYYREKWFSDSYWESSDLQDFIKRDKYELAIEIGDLLIRKKTQSEKDEEEENESNE